MHPTALKTSFCHLASAPPPLQTCPPVGIVNVKCAKSRRRLANATNCAAVSRSNSEGWPRQYADEHVACRNSKVGAAEFNSCWGRSICPSPRPQNIDLQADDRQKCVMSFQETSVDRQISSAVDRDVSSSGDCVCGTFSEVIVGWMGTET